MITLGPYGFTTTDAQRTLSHIDILWDVMMQGRHSNTADAVGAGLAATLATIMGAAPDTSLADLSSLSATALNTPEQLAGALAAAWDSLAAASDALRADGQLPATAQGTVTQLSSSNGGVPKLALNDVDVDFGGVVGDMQGTRNHHGRPWQALCLYSEEIINDFRAQGHPIARGSAGENVTVSGLDWADVRPGVRLQIGSVIADVQAYATPCRHNAQWFRDGDFNRMRIDRGAVSRVYATVREPGHVSTGDIVTLEP